MQEPTSPLWSFKSACSLTIVHAKLLSFRVHILLCLESACACLFASTLVLFDSLVIANTSSLLSSPSRRTLTCACKPKEKRESSQLHERGSSSPWCPPSTADQNSNRQRKLRCMERQLEVSSTITPTLKRPSIDVMISFSVQSNWWDHTCS